jgi:uncharacterized protein (TIGR00369 family)
LPANVLSVPELETWLAAAPFNRWMDLRVLGLDEDGIDIGFTWRAEMVSNPVARVVHGGVLGALIDSAADFAIAAKLGRPVPTVDLRIDYHRPATPGDLRARAWVVRMGSTLAVAEAEVYDAAGVLVASGRGTYFTAEPRDEAKR